MAKYLSDLDFLSPAPSQFEPAQSAARARFEPPAAGRFAPRRTLELEREESEFARVSRQLDRIEIQRQKLEFRDPVSSKYPEVDDDRLSNFADRLLRENARKQAEPGIVARNIRRTTSVLAEEAGFRSPRAPRIESKDYTAFVKSKRVDDIPRTVFGTEAWTKPGSQIRRQFINKYLALPCVERIVRREVLFARGKGGRGYRVRHRMSKFSDIWC